MSYREKKNLQENLTEFKSKYEQALIENDRKAV